MATSWTKDRRHWNSGSLIFAAVTLFWVTFLFSFATEANAEICRKLNKSFECPRLFESKKKIWCCRSNTFESHCCEWSERAKELGMDIPLPKLTFNFILLSILAFFFLGLMVALCVYLTRMYKDRTRNDFPHRDTRYHQSGGVRSEFGSLPPPPPPLPSSYYQNNGHSPAYYHNDQPPPYHTLNTSPTTPLLDMDTNGHLNGNRQGSDEFDSSAPPPPATLPPPATPPSGKLGPNQQQPPFNPAYTTDNKK